MPHSPPPPSNSILTVPFQAPGPPPSLTPQSSHTPGYHTRYELHDDGEQDMHDTGDIPLLQRDPSRSSYNMPMPGKYEGEGNEDDAPEINIRYGRIPQRVPRRYKTIKRVE